MFSRFLNCRNGTKSRNAPQREELIELVIEELITQYVISRIKFLVIFNKKIVQGLDSFYKLNQKEVPIPTGNPFIKISET